MINQDKRKNITTQRKFLERSTWVPEDSKLPPGVLNCANNISRDFIEYLDTCDRLTWRTDRSNNNYNVRNNKHVYNGFNNTINNTVRNVTINNLDYSNKCTLYENSFIRTNDKNNINNSEIQGLRDLQNDNSIVIKPFDKGGGIAIMDRVHYINEASRQLLDPKYYKKLDKLLITETAIEIKNILNDMYMLGKITKKQFNYLTGPARFRPRIFYLLPKIHKAIEKWPHPKMPPGRPIVSDIDSESYRVSELIEHYINPLSDKHPSYIKNSYEFVNTIRNKEINKNCFIVTADINSLYTNMHIDRSVDCVRQALRENPELDRPDEHLLKLLDLTMRTNDFEFNGEYFLQILGTAMGKRYAPSLANIYLREFDKKATEGFRIKPKFYFRYLDDIFFIWEGGEGELKEYEKYLNSLIPDITISLEYNRTQNNFLDTTIYKQHSNDITDTLQTKVYFKDTDTHQLLHKDSFHPKHTFRGLIRSQYIRFKRLSSTHQDYIHTCNTLNTYLKNRGYTFTQLRGEMQDIWYNYQEKDRSTQGEEPDIFPIVTNFSKEGITLSKKFRDTLQNTDQFRDKKIITAFQANKNVKSMLVRSRLPPAYDGNFEPCEKSRCLACSHAQRGESFHSSTFQKTFKYIQKNNCGSRNIIYLITCQKCGMQYVGETARELRHRLTDHRHCIRAHVPTPVGKHFNLPEHRLEDLKITVLESLEATRGDWKLRREKELGWQLKLGTIQPQGINETLYNM